MTSITIITVTKNRHKQLIDVAGNSLIKQTNQNFEWFVISDGKCQNTEDAIKQLISDVSFPIKYWQIDTQPKKFGLCVGRNLGIANAQSKYITYLDDDNSFTPDFVDSVFKFYSTNPSINYCLPLANRTRGIWSNNQLKITSSFISPVQNTTIVELVIHQQLFDSNGFVHLNANCPQWNRNYRIYCDYEYFLQCLNVWNEATFALLPQVLINYLQTTTGIIGQSSYRDWAIELKKIIENAHNYLILQANPKYIDTLKQLQEKYQTKQEKDNTPKAFKKKVTK
jgi:glycosyltransferase involved in cell wall biosynthesis